MVSMDSLAPLVTLGILAPPNPKISPFRNILIAGPRGHHLIVVLRAFESDCVLSRCYRFSPNQLLTASVENLKGQNHMGSMVDHDDIHKVINTQLVCSTGHFFHVCMRRVTTSFWLMILDDFDLQGRQLINLIREFSRNRSATKSSM